MKKSVVAIILCIGALMCPSFALGQFGMGCCPEGLSEMSCVTIRGVRVVPWLGFGYQSMGMNVNYPFSGTLGVVFQNLDVRLKNNALWVGSLGIDAALRQRLRFFGTAGTNLFVSNAGSLGTDRYVGAGGGLVGNPANSLDWTGTKLRWWELNLGGLYCLTDDVAILLGYKTDKFTEQPELGDYAFSGVYQGVPYAGVESYSSDFEVITRSPYIGLKVCQPYLDVSLIWSPFLTSYDVKIPLRVLANAAWRGGTQLAASDSRWELNAAGGNLLEAFAQTKFNIRERFGVNLWLRGSWLHCRGNGDLDQSLLLSGTLFNVVATDSGSSSNSVFTRYLWALGISGQLTF